MDFSQEINKVKQMAIQALNKNVINYSDHAVEPQSLVDGGLTLQVQPLIKSFVFSNGKNKVSINPGEDKINNKVNDEIIDKNDIDDITKEIDKKLDKKADKLHTHPELQLQINDKADIKHTHPGLEKKIKEKADKVHRHEDLERDIKGKADIKHTHKEFDDLKVVNLDVGNLNPVYEFHDRKLVSIGPNFSLGFKIYGKDFDLYLASRIRDLMYPTGSIFVSMCNQSPEFILGVFWEPILDRFLYCTDNRTHSKETGGSKKITVDNLPPHSHKIDLTTDANFHLHRFENR